MFQRNNRIDVKALFTKHPVSCLIKPGDITKEFKEKATQFRGTFHGSRITN